MPDSLARSAFFSAATQQNPVNKCAGFRGENFLHNVSHVSLNLLNGGRGVGQEAGGGGLAAALRQSGIQQTRDTRHADTLAALRHEERAGEFAGSC